MKITTKKINHLGIISGLFHEFELVEFIDELLPKTRDHNITHGQVILAMCLNGLGFSDTRLYLYADYFKDLPTERLIGEGVLPEHLTDDVLERTLDKIFEYGCTELFNQIILHIMQKVPLGTNVLHTDTTNFSLYGKYASVDPGFETIDITYGHAKDMRYDLKRFVLSMVCNQHGIPLFMEALSGNASDKKTLVQTVQKIQDSLLLGDDVLHIADSAIYSDDNITKLGKSTLWITRIPATINQVQDLLTADLDMKLCEDERYFYYEVSSSYGGIEQKWIVVYSNESKESRIKTFEKNLKNQEVATSRKLKKLMKKEFNCEIDARNDAEKWIQDQALFEFDELTIEKKNRRMNGMRGRPRKDEVLKEYYCIKATLKLNEEVVEERRSKCGRFVLGTNDLSLSPDQILSYYKDQGFVERGFKFIKDKSFHVSEVYLKKPHRIESLSMIMVLCLFLYSYAQWRLRSRLVETGTYVRNQVKKQVQNPTMKWIFFLFRNITEVKVTMGDQSETTVSNMRDELWHILELMGPIFKKYYI